MRGPIHDSILGPERTRGEAVGIRLGPTFVAGLGIAQFALLSVPATPRIRRPACRAEIDVCPHRLVIPIALLGENVGMSLQPTEFVKQVIQLHREAVVRWHEQDVDNPHDGLQAVVCQQHQFNFLLWHEEDVARSTDVNDSRIAQVKRAIDGYNQQRNDWIERVDEELIRELASAGVEPKPGARLNTETPGSAIDRLSIMSLRIYHLEEQLLRDDVDQEHLDRVNGRLQRCHLQQSDLSNSLAELLDDLFAGDKQLRVYRQMKMYNDRSMNPYLYDRSKQAA